MKRLDLPDAVERYVAGESTKSIAKSYGISTTPIVTRLKEAGVYRDMKDAQRLIRGTPSIDEASIAERYVNGESEKALANLIGCSRDVIRRILVKSGVPIRGRSDAMYLRMAQATPEQRLALTDAAHAAVRGVPKSEEHRFEVAKSREQRLSVASPVEIDLADRLRIIGVESVPQKAVGPYNVDVALTESSIAVEVFGGHWHGSGYHARTYRKRTDYLVDRDWLPIVIWVTPAYPLADAAIQYIVARHQERCRHKAFGGEEHVIRGDGEGGPISHRYPKCVPAIEGPKPRNDS